jgi:ADP-heptose:LPS heptosyltransferase
MKKNDIKNFFIKTLTLTLKPFFFRSRNSFNNKNNILIVTTTAIGDTIWATPLIKSIKNNMATSTISVLTSPIGSDILDNNPYIDEIFVTKKNLTLHFFSLLKTLHKKKFDKILLFHASQRLILPLCCLLRPQFFAATKGINKNLDCLLTHSIIWPENHHEISRREDIVAKALNITSKDRSLYYYPRQSERDSAATFLSKKNIMPVPSTTKIIAIHVGAKDNYKCYPKTAIISLILLLKQEMDCEILLTGGTSDKTIAEYITSKINGVTSICGDVSLRNFAAILETIDVFITNDTGPMHLASSLKVKMIALFSPTDPLIYGPINNSNTEIIYYPKTCSPCFKRKCNDPFCLLQISPTAIVLKVKKLLQKEKCHEPS